ncbi:hypothetical protein [Persicitalea sp.]|uniref:hypothetical protein n=1 Tax=Persicitalea sp. TaxID=3100273 RepID=UPI0035943E88
MNKQKIIERTISAINRLPADKAEEISTFADFVSKRYEETQLGEDMRKLAMGSQVFDFLDDEEELYSEADLIEVFNG